MNMLAEDALVATLDAMQDWLLQGDERIAAFADESSIAHRLRIYADAYRLRLLEVLGDDFPIAKAMLGNDAFDALAAGYLRTHPSTRPSARHLGHAFADWLATRRDLPCGLHELVRFEWTQGECFDAEDAPALGIGDIASLPAEAWAGLRLRLHPATRLLALACNAAEIIEAHAAGLPLPEPRAGAASACLLWRSDGDVHWRRLDDDEASALRAIAGDGSFARLCERMNDLHGDDGALRAASLLKRWLADGLLAAP